MKIRDFFSEGGWNAHTHKHIFSYCVRFSHTHAWDENEKSMSYGISHSQTQTHIIYLIPVVVMISLNPYNFDKKTQSQVPGRCRKYFSLFPYLELSLIALLNMTFSILLLAVHEHIL